MNFINLNYPIIKGQGQLQEPRQESEEDQAGLRGRRRQAAQGRQAGAGAERDLRAGGPAATAQEGNRAAQAGHRQGKDGRGRRSYRNHGPCITGCLIMS